MTRDDFISRVKSDCHVDLNGDTYTTIRCRTILKRWCSGRHADPLWPVWHLSQLGPEKKMACSNSQPFGSWDSDMKGYYQRNNGVAFLFAADRRDNDGLWSTLTNIWVPTKLMPIPTSSNEIEEFVKSGGQWPL